MPPTKANSNNKKVLNKSQRSQPIMQKQKQTISKDTVPKEISETNVEKTTRDEHTNQEKVEENKDNSKESNSSEDTQSKSSDSTSDSDSSDEEELTDISNTNNNKTKEKEEKDNIPNTKPIEISSKVQPPDTNSVPKVEVSAQPNPADTIRFSVQSKNYSFLSNYYCVDIVIDDKQYYHVEGYYQSCKFVNIDDSLAKRIQFIRDPIVVSKRGNSYKMTDERKNEWDSGLRNRVMKRAIYTKFITSSELSNKLLSTGNSILVENSSDNTYWAVDKDTKDENKLGKILMEVRSVLSKIL